MAKVERTPLHDIRDAILRMTWRDLEGLAELLEERRISETDHYNPITGAVLNDFAYQLELEGDK